MTHIEILRTYNDWRRDMVGEKTLEDFGITPRMIGEALDAVINDARCFQWLLNQGDSCQWMNILRVDPDDFDSLEKAIDAAMAKESRQ